MWYINIFNYCLDFKKEEILPFATRWTDLQNITLGEISQSQKDRHYTISNMESK